MGSNYYIVPETTSNRDKGGEQSETIRTVISKGGYTYELSTSDLALKQSAFTAGNGVSLTFH